MFNDKRQIIWASKTTLRVATVEVNEESPNVKTEKDIPWTKDDVVKKFEDLKRDLHGPFVFVLDDDISFTVPISIPSDIKDPRSFARIRAAEEIPEKLGDYGWDYKVQLESLDKKEKVAQFAAVMQEYYAIFARAVKDSGIAVEAAETALFAQARLISGINSPVLVCYKHPEERTIVFIAYRGLVIASQTFVGEPSTKDIVALLEFAKEKEAMTPTVAILSGAFTSLHESDKAFSKMKVEKAELDVFLGAAMKPEVNTKDENTLNITFDWVPAISSTAKLENKLVGVSDVAKDGVVRYEAIGLETETVRKYPQGKWFTFIIIGVAILITLINAYILYERAVSESIFNAAPTLLKTPPPETPASAASATSTATSTKKAPPTNPNMLK